MFTILNLTTCACGTMLNVSITVRQYTNYLFWKVANSLQYISSRLQGSLYYDAMQDKFVLHFLSQPHLSKRAKDMGLVGSLQAVYLL